MTLTTTVTANITLGVAHGPDHTVSFTFECPPELRPDDVFEAANAVADLDYDCNMRLTTDWQRMLRAALDHNHAPSMSVQDHFTLTPPRGDTTRYTCDRLGWTITTETAQ